MQAFANILVLLLCLTVGIETADAKLKKTTFDNQTSQLSPILPETELPFRIVIEQANFQLPVGFHSGVVGVYNGLWVFIAGRINGLHGFNPFNNFPPDQQNTSIYVVNSATGVVSSRSLYDAGSGLTQQQIDTLSVTSPEGYQADDTLYMAGGYGVDTSTSTFGTKPVLTAIYLPGIVQWVMQPQNKNNSVVKNIRQLYHPIFQITGGKMQRIGNTTELVFGQNFDGDYTDSSNGNYSEQVRQFQINNVGGQLSVDIFNSLPARPDPSFRRRDLNVLPSLLNNNGILQYGLVAYAGVFTITSGVWTVPVIINGNSNPVMNDPALPGTFKQGMNQYTCASVSFYSRQSASMYHLLLGGISYGFYDHGVFSTDSEIPFINQVTTVQMDQRGNFTQYLMSGQYPVILSTGSNPGNPLLFGAGAYFLPTSIQQYPNGVINLDNLRRKVVIGYIVGGIQSTLANTNTMADSSASPYIFKVTLVPKTKSVTGVQSSASRELAHVAPPTQQGLLRVAHVE